jgi:hypothetical protein
MDGIFDSLNKYFDDVISLAEPFEETCTDGFDGSVAEIHAKTVETFTSVASCAMLSGCKDVIKSSFVEGNIGKFLSDFVDEVNSRLLGSFLMKLVLKTTVDDEIFIFDSGKLSATILLLLCDMIRYKTANKKYKIYLDYKIVKDCIDIVVRNNADIGWNRDFPSSEDGKVESDVDGLKISLARQLIFEMNAKLTIKTSKRSRRSVSVSIPIIAKGAKAVCAGKHMLDTLLIDVIVNRIMAQVGSGTAQIKSKTGT